VAYLFSSSVFGEYAFSDVPHAFYWLIVWGHVLACGLALRAVDGSRETLMAGALIVCGVASVGLLTFKYPLGSSMDFRYMAWSWPAWAVLYSRGLHPDASFRGIQLFSVPALVFMIVCPLQVYVLLALLHVA
jgi:hypothetical protein